MYYLKIQKLMINYGLIQLAKAIGYSDPKNALRHIQIKVIVYS